MRLAAFLSLLVISFASTANPVEVGGAFVEIPTPSGFARVTLEMTGVVEFQKHFVPPTNQQLASFISEGDVPAALEGRIPDLTRRFTVQVAKKVAGHQLTNAEFSQLKQMYKGDDYITVELCWSRAAEVSLSRSHLTVSENGFKCLATTSLG